MAEEKGKEVNLSINLNFSAKKLAKIGVLVFTFIFTFIKWVKASASYLGVTESERRAIFSVGFDETLFWGFAKILAIISIVLFVICLAGYFLDYKKLIPQLKNVKFDVTQYLDLGYYAVVLVALFFTFIGRFTAETVSYFGITGGYHLGFGWYITLVLTLVGIVLSLKPELVKQAVNTVKSAKK